MTDNEIIKALECCLKLSVKECPECPYYRKEDCSSTLIQDTLDLINRQKAEIERLQSILLKFMDEVAKWEEKKGIDVSELPLIPICDEGRDIIDHYRAQAIRQFAERLKEKAWHGMWEVTNHVDVDDIDNLVKEMVGEG
jgi:hypothetical protein